VEAGKPSQNHPVCVCVCVCLGFHQFFLLSLECSLAGMVPHTLEWVWGCVEGPAAEVGETSGPEAEASGS
jgi:hypothetical protein